MNSNSLQTLQENFAESFLKNQAHEFEVQKQLLELKDRFKHMADLAPVLLWITREDGMCTYFNQSWLEFRGRSLEDEKGFGWAEGIHPEDYHRALSTIFKHFNRRQPFEVEYRLKNRNGEYRWIMARGSPRYGSDHRYAGFTGSCVDITDHKKLIEELQAAKAAADFANLSKTQFLANVSHEIRTPLGIILGFAEIIRNEKISEEEKNNLLDRLLKSGHQLLNIIDDVLDVSKVEADKIEIELIEFSLPDLIQDIRELFELRAQEKGLLFKTNIKNKIPEYIKGDPTRIRQILTNIIGNSIKFTAQGEVALNISFKSINQKSILDFEVTDTGVGLNPESRDRIFKPFSQVDASTTRKFGGTGLGLHLSRKLARVMGGDLELVKSEAGIGSCFLFSIPIEIIAEPKKLIPTGFENPIQYENLRNTDILVVDDAEENRILIGRYLSPFQVNLFFASNGEDAVEQCHKKNFDLILMDIQMPVLDGYGALEKIRKFNKTTPVIALTAHALKTERDNCLRAGFEEHITKPVNKQKLVSYISSLLSQKKSNIMSTTR
jgi:two-component system CheB/CheR fusion protein